MRIDDSIDDKDRPEVSNSRYCYLEYLSNSAMTYSKLLLKYISSRESTSFACEGQLDSVPARAAEGIDDEIALAALSYVDCYLLRSH